MSEAKHRHDSRTPESDTFVREEEPVIDIGHRIKLLFIVIYRLSIPCVTQ